MVPPADSSVVVIRMTITVYLASCWGRTGRVADKNGQERGADEGDTHNQGDKDAIEAFT